MPKPTRATGGGGGKAGPAKSGGKPALPPADAAAPDGTGRGAARAGRPASAAAAVPAKAKAAAGSPAKKPPLPPRATGTRAAAHPPPPAPEPPGPAAAASLFAQVVSAAHRAKRELAALGGEAVDLALGLAAPRPRRGAAIAGAATAPAPADAAAARSAGAATTSAPAVPPLPTWNIAAPPPRGAGAPFPPPSPKGRRTPRGPGGGRSPARRGRKVGGRGSGKAGGGGGGAFARSPLRLSVQMGSAAAAAAAVAAATAAAAAVERRRGHAIAPHGVGDHRAPPAPPPVPSPSGRPVRAAAVAATAAVAANLAPTRVHMAAPAPEAGPGGPTAAAALRAARRDRSSTRHRRLFLPGLPGALTHGQPLTYRTPDGIVLLTGAAVVPPAGAPPTAAAGIHCAHCGEVVSAAAFEAHAGRAARRAPYDSTFTADGVSLRSLAAALPAPAAGEGVGHYPPGAPLEGGGGGGAAVPGGMAPATTATGTHPPLDLIPGGCVLCHRSDFQLAGFGPRTIIICDQCEREFHVDCLAASGRARLAGLPEGLWFCSPECHRISGSLRRVVAAGERPLPPGTHALHILRGRDGSRPTDAALRTATDLLAEAFDPILDAGTGLDLTTAMVSASQLGDWDYTGMFTALLKHKGVPVCAAVFRVFGPQVAELPLIATAAAARRRGHARVLVGALERLLAQLGVRGLCLPAAHETVGHWKDGFGFSVLEAGALRAARAELRLLVFPGTEVLSKKLGQARGPPLLVPPPPGRGSYGGGEAGRAPAEARNPTSPPPMIGGRSFATAGALAHLNGLTPAEAAEEAEAAAAAAARTRGGTGGGGGPGPGSRRPGAAVTAPRPPPPPPPRSRATATAGAAAAGAGAAKRRAAADPAPARLAKAGKAAAGKAAGGGGKASASARRPPSPPLRGRAATAAAAAPTPRLTRARSTH